MYKGDIEEIKEIKGRNSFLLFIEKMFFFTISHKTPVKLYIDRKKIEKILPCRIMRFEMKSVF